MLFSQRAVSHLSGTNVAVLSSFFKHSIQNCGQTLCLLLYARTLHGCLKAFKLPFLLKLCISHYFQSTLYLFPSSPRSQKDLLSTVQDLQVRFVLTNHHNLELISVRFNPGESRTDEKNQFNIQTQSHNTGNQLAAVLFLFFWCFALSGLTIHNPWNKNLQTKTHILGNKTNTPPQPPKKRTEHINLQTQR